MSSGERKRRSPNHLRMGFWARHIGIVLGQRNGLGRPAKAGDSPVRDVRGRPGGIPKYGGARETLPEGPQTIAEG